MSLSDSTYRGRIVLAAPVASEPTHALVRAAALSLGSASELVILRVLAPSRGSAPPLGAVAGAHVTARTLRWRQRALPTRVEADRIIARKGDFLSVVSDTARAFRARFIVIPDIAGQSGGSIRELALEAKMPVLVARETGGAQVTDTIVAATDLATPGFPVLRVAADLCEGLEARLVLVNNASDGSDSCRPLTADSVLDRLERLRAFAAARRIDGVSMVLHRPTLADAVFEVSARERADLVLIGTRRRLGSRDDAAAESLIENLACSVLVVPADSAPS